MSDLPSEPRPTSREGLVGIFVDRPVMALMLTIAVLAVGAIALTRMPLQLSPDGMTADSINLWIPIRRDMPPKEVEERIARPLEAQLRTIPGIRHIEVECGSSRVFARIELDNDTDATLAAAEVRDRSQRARLSWPTEVDQFFTWREDMSGAPLAFLRLRTPDRNAEWDFRIDQVVRPRLEAIDGVGQVDVWGLLDETLRIWFDRDKLVEHRVDYGDILRRLAEDNFARPVGEVDDGHRRAMVRVDARFKSREDIERWPIRPGLVIGDVARVLDVPSVRDNLSKFEGKYTYTAIVRLAAGVNPVEASHNLTAALQSIEADPELSGIGFTPLFDQGKLIEQSLQTLLSTSLQGGLLALLVLWLFLRNLRVTLVVALAIPLALVIAVGWMYFTGGSFNVVSMAGLTLAVGMVVDNSVVVLENIRRRRAEGMGQREACVQGTREIILPVTMATLTTVVVIVPLLFMSSQRNVGTIFSALGVPLSVALLGSLFVAILLLPSAVRRAGLGRMQFAGDETPIGRFSPMRPVLALNRMLLRGVLGPFWVRCVAALLSIVLFATIGMAWAGLSLDQGGESMRRGDVTINLEVPRGMTLSDVADEVKRYEEHLDTQREAQKIKTVASRFSRRSIRFDITVDASIPRSEYRQIANRLRESWPVRPGVRLTLRDSGGGMGRGSAADDQSSKRFVLRLYGPDSEFLADKALEVRDRLARMPEIVRCELDQGDAGEEVVMRLDRDRLSDLQVRPESIERTTSSGLRGSELTRFVADGRDVRLISQFDAEENPTLWDLKETKVFSGGGGFQRMEDLVDFRFERSLREIDRLDGKTQVVVVGERRDEVTSQRLSGILEQVMESTVLPRGYTWSETSPTSDTAEDFQELTDAGFLSCVLILLLMGVLFESLVLPAAIMVTVPFSLVGAFWSLRLIHGSIDVMTFIGIVLLAGVVVNNGIVLLDCIERLRREGFDRKSAILEGTRIRLRPILMTASTTIAGLLPMALFGESSDGGISYVGMSIAVSGGLAFSTLFTAFAVPLAYVFFDDVSNWGRGILASILGAPPRTDSATQLVESANPQSL